MPIELVTVYDAVRRDWALQIDEVADRLGYDDVDVVCVGSGWTGDVIVDTVTEQPGTVLCMATHNRDQLSRLVVGSVTEHVIRTLRSPVLMIGPKYRADHEQVRYGRCLVCLTNSPRDRTSLAVARSWARQLGVELELVHVFSESIANTDDIEDYLHTEADNLNAEGIVTTFTLCSADRPADGVNSILDERPDSIVLLNSHRRVGITRLVLGSLASELLETCPAPLLLTSHS